MPYPRELRIPLTWRTAQLLTLVAGLALCGAVLYGQTKVNNTAASLVNKTLVTQQDAQTITGLFSYSRGTNAPFAVLSGSARVDNLNAQYLSGVAVNTGIPALSGGFATTFYTTAATSITMPSSGVVQASSNWTTMTVPMTGTALSLSGAVTLTGPLTGAGARGCDVRATLTSLTPVTTADVTAATTIFVTPYVAQGGGPAYCSFYDGSTYWTAVPVTEQTVALGTLTSGLPYDVFCSSNAGAVSCSAPVAWATTGARATALALQNGVWVKSGATTQRYITSFHTTSTTTTEDSKANRYLYNYYNRVPRLLAKLSATNWNYTTATWRQANGGTGALQVGLLTGVQEEFLDLNLTTNYSNSTAAVGAYGQICVGENSTTAPHASCQSGLLSEAVGGDYNPMSALLKTVPPLGQNIYYWLEFAAANGTATWNGQVNIGGLSGSTRQ